MPATETHHQTRGKLKTDKIELVHDIFFLLMSKFSLSEHREKYGKYAYKMMLECIGLKTHIREWICIY